MTADGKRWVSFLLPAQSRFECWNRQNLQTEEDGVVEEDWAGSASTGFTGEFFHMS